MPATSQISGLQLPSFRRAALREAFLRVAAIVAVWAVFYASFALVRPPLLDDADSVHAEVAREMLLRHDWITLYANGIRYLEKAPVLYWSMAACMRVSQALGLDGPHALAVAARVPLALTVLALAFVTAAFASSVFRNPRAGLYAALVLLSSPGVFLFSRILLPDAMVCLWLAIAMYAFWRTQDPLSRAEMRPVTATSYTTVSRRWARVFAAACALNVLTKGLIGIVFPVGIAVIYLVVTRGFRGAWGRVRVLQPLFCAAVFVAIAAPWHIAIALANPTQGDPGGLGFTLHPAAGASHWSVPLPTDGNVHGWTWFYFVNEQVLRYLNLRVPRDYDTVPLWLFWGLCVVWLMPWSGFLWGVVQRYFPVLRREWWRRQHKNDSMFYFGGGFLLAVWAVVVLGFFLFSTRQEYYVLPALPALAILVGGWLSEDSLTATGPMPNGLWRVRRTALWATGIWAALGVLFAIAAAVVLLRAQAPAPGTDLASLLAQNPGDYAMSMGHFLDLNAQALGLFRVPLVLAAVSLAGGPIVSLALRRRGHPHVSTLALAAGAFGFLLAAHLGLQTFAPVLSSAQLAESIRPLLAHAPGEPEPLVVIHQEYEFGSTLGFYLQLPRYAVAGGRPVAQSPIHILTDPEYRGTRDYGRSSNLWYGSFFADAPKIFETRESLAAQWAGPGRVLLWQDLGNEPSGPPALPGPVYLVAKGRGKEILSNRPAR